MTMFSSLRPFNNDPLPFYCESGDHRTEGRMVPATAGQGYVTHPCSHFWKLSRRPEYDLPQHNPTNPILVKFRERSYPVAYWVHRLSKGDLPCGVEASIEQIDHARRVLTRLTNFTKEN